MTAEGKLRGTKKFHVKRKFFHLIFKKCGSGRMISNKIQKTFISPVKVPEENSFNFLRLVCCLIVIYERVFAGKLRADFEIL